MPPRRRSQSLQALRDAVAGADEGAGVPPSGSFGSGAADGAGGGLGGVDKALGTATQAAGGAAKAIGEVRTEAEDLAADPADQRRAEPRQPLRRADHRGDER